MKQKRAGFTLIEIILVVVIMSLIAAIVVPRFFSKVESSKQKIARMQILMLENAVKLFKLDTGRYPSSEEGLAVLQKNPGGIVHWDGPYMEKSLPKDPWGYPFQYTCPGAHWDFEIKSLGADGRPGGEGENQDVSNYSVDEK